MTEEKVRTKLEGQKAINLWQKGKDEWNQWVKENPEADVSFEGVDFSQYRTKDRPRISFENFNFPKGYVDYSKTTFGAGDVNFSDAVFGAGDVNFNDAAFGDGDVIFSDTTFGVGEINFSDVTFGAGDVNFSDAAFGDGAMSFSDTTFGSGDVSFKGAIFGDGILSFNRTTFGEGIVDFKKTTFQSEKISFYAAKFKGQVVFENCEFTDNLKQFTFQNAQFEDALTLQNMKVPCPIDFRNTKLSNQLSLGGLTCRLNRKREKGFEIIEDKEDIHRFTRLKELAENNKAHEQAMAFHADEQRAKRWVKTGFFGSLMDMVFSEASNYGQSVMRPAFYFITSILIFASLYCGMADKEHQHPNEKVSLVLTVSLANSVPFLSINKNTKEYLLPKLFDKPKLHKKLYWLMGTQALVSMMLLFLIGLGLRNRFRI